MDVGQMSLCPFERMYVQKGSIEPGWPWQAFSLAADFFHRIAGGGNDRVRLLM